MESSSVADGAAGPREWAAVVRSQIPQRRGNYGGRRNLEGAEVVPAVGAEGARLTDDPRLRLSLLGGDFTAAGEDRSTAGAGHAPQVMATFRNAAIGLIRSLGTTRITAATRLFRALSFIAV